MADKNERGPDLTQGVDPGEVARDAMLVGHVGDASVLLAWLDDDLVAVDAACTHYGAPLGKGLRVGETVRCPWHHACFSLRTGEALEAPAFDSISLWRVERADGRVYVRERMAKTDNTPPATSGGPRRIVVVGGGAASFAAIHRLRALGYDGELTLVSDENRLPCDRTKLSKAYLAGKASANALPLKNHAFYDDREVRLRLGAAAEQIDTSARRLTLAGGETLDYDALLLAPGAEPRRLDAPGLDRQEVHILRSQADSDAIIAAAGRAERVAIVGSSFIGLEVAAALRQRGLEVDVIAQEDLPLESKMGPQIGGFVKALHEAQGVRFHLGREVARFEDGLLVLNDGTQVQADLVVVGVGVSPRLDLARAARLTTGKGVRVDAGFRASARGVFAVGDIAEFPDPLTGEPIRVEHWVAAQRQGQIAAANMLGGDERFEEPPFFWSAHYGASLRYVGHASGWDRIEVDGDLAAKDAEVRFVKDGEVRAVAVVGRDTAALKAAQTLREQAHARPTAEQG